MADAGEGPSVVKKDDSVLALSILFIAIVGVIIAFLYYRSKNVKRSTGAHQSSFEPPPERAEYLNAKASLNVAKVPDLEQLKKLLMKRAMKTIPIVLSLQNEGSSIERLYKRGMLTDDMHFKVKELKAFVDQEFADIQAEAEDLVEGWGQHIWPQSMQFHQMIQKQTEAKLEEQKLAEEAKRKAEKEQQKSVRAPREVKPVDPVPLVDAETNKVNDADKLAKKVIEEEEKDQPSSASKKKANKKK